MGLRHLRDVGPAEGTPTGVKNLNLDESCFIRKKKKKK